MTNLSNKEHIDNFREKVKISFLIFSLLFSLLGTCNLQAQDSATSELGDDLWPVIEAQLDQQKSDTTFYFIVQQIRDQCGNDFDCLYDTYAIIRRQIETNFNLPAAIYLSYEMVKIAKEEGDLESEGHAYLNLRRFYGAMKNRELSAINTEKALTIFEKTDNQYIIAVLKMSKLEDSLVYKDYEDVVPEMNALLADMKGKGEDEAANNLHLRMMHISLREEHYEEAIYHIESLEKLAISNPLKEDEYAYAITTNLGRADIAKIEKDLSKAEVFYQKALRLCEAQPSRWLEISTLHSLANLEWERGNINLTKSYLDRAKPKAEELNIDEFLVENYAFQAKISEKEGRYADALVNTKQEYFYKEKIKEQNVDF